MNAMKEIRVEKVTLNVGTGTDKEKLDRAKKLLESFQVKDLLANLEVELSGIPAFEITDKQAACFALGHKRQILKIVLVVMSDQQIYRFRGSRHQ